MAHKASVGIKSRMPEGKVSVKYVKRAKMWCKTYFEYNHDRGTATQRQEWTIDKPSE